MRRRPSRRGVLAVGVDGCRGGWVAVATQDGAFARADFFPAFDALLDAFPGASVFGVDVPIGLLERGHRACDLAAKRLLGGTRQASVFLTPPRPVLEAPSYAAARVVAQRLGGPGVSAQAHALRARILEVGRLAAADRRVREVHPEVSFRLLAGRPLRAGKKTDAGRAERRRLLGRAGLRLPPLRALRARARAPAPDDWLDAAAAAWSARRVALGEARRLADATERSVDGRAIAIHA